MESFNGKFRDECLNEHSHLLPDMQLKERAAARLDEILRVKPKEKTPAKIKKIW